MALSCGANYAKIVLIIVNIIFLVRNFESKLSQSHVVRRSVPYRQLTKSVKLVQPNNVVHVPYNGDNDMLGNEIFIVFFFGGAGNKNRGLPSNSVIARIIFGRYSRF